MIDPTGVEAGLASFLSDQLGRHTSTSGEGDPTRKGTPPERVLGTWGLRRVLVSPFLFNRKTTSDLGWAFISQFNVDPSKEYADDMGWAGGGSAITRIYRHQLAACTFDVLPGPGKLLRETARTNLC